MHIVAIYTGDVILVPTRNDADSLYQDGYGSFQGDERFLILEPCEVLYLLEKGKISVISESTKDKLVFREVFWLFSRFDSNLWIKFVVYRDLRTRGFILKTALEPKMCFFVYQRGAYGKKPPKYFVHVLGEGVQESIRDLDEMLELAKKEEKILKLAVVDRRGEIVYYTLSALTFN
jgi:tRNA-intron endonuclease